jgi:type II secretory pathway pseudopilin PulG
MKERQINVLAKLLVVAMVFGMLTPLISHAQQGSDARIKKLEAAVQSLQTELNALKAERAKEAAKAPPVVDQKQLEKLVSNTFEDKKDELGAVPNWVKNIKISGDLRYRHESIDAQTDSDWARGHNRNRVRARLNINAKLDEGWDLGFRLASGSADPASTNQTLADSFSTKGFWLDLAYFDWHPLSMEGLNLYGGKMKNPFYKVGKTELVWDGDLNPEGIAAKYVMPLSESDNLHINGGGFWVDESSSGVDTSLWGIQTYLNHEFENKQYVLGGLSYYDYGNIKNRGSLQNTWSTGTSFFGNTATGTIYDSDYDLVEGFAEYGFQCGGMPLAVFGNYVQNTVASTGEDEAWLIGLKVNKAKDPGSWDFRYNYRELEADAVLGAFADSDFIGGGTDGKGHEFGLNYQLTKNIQAGLTYFINERDRGSGSDDNYRRLQADLIFKF